MASEPLTYFHCGGDVFFRNDGKPMAISHLAEGLRDQVVDEARAAMAAGDLSAGKLAARHYTQLTLAMDDRANWIKAATAPVSRCYAPGADPQPNTGAK